MVFREMGCHESLAALLLLLALTMQLCGCFTDPQDADALGVLYTSLNSPPLTGWNLVSRDPCEENWQGIECAGPNITAIRLSGLGITGWLGNSLGNFSGLLTLDLSSNSLSQMIPFQLPPRIQEVNLAYNQLTEALPASFKDMISLISLNISNNQLVGALPDVFSDLSSLTSLDVSSNRFTGPLPPSMASLTSLLTLRMQNNQLSGDISVIGGLPQLQDIDVTNNAFTGPVPASFAANPNFKGSGNLFTGSAVPTSAPAPAPAPSPLSFGGPSPADSPGPGPFVQQPNSSAQDRRNPDHKLPLRGGSVVADLSRKKYWSAGKVAGLAVAGLLAIIASMLVVLFFCGKRKVEKEEEVISTKSSWHQAAAVGKASGDLFTQPRTPATKPLAPPPVEKLKPQAVSPLISPPKAPQKRIQVSVPTFSIAELQAATNSFSQDNLVGEGSLGRVYRAEFSDGRVLAVKKLDTAAVNAQSQEEFLGIVAMIARLRHPHISELVGYCSEHAQRLLVYSFLDHGTLYDTLHNPADRRNWLSWNQRVKIALGAARALEYLHEVCAPTVVHRNFKSANILLDQEDNARVSDCGLAALAPFGSERQFSHQMLGSFGYSAPEFAMSGVYTSKSDVYSYGVVMLELLTGRKSLDSSRPRAEQSLVRWAIPQLHDIDSLSRMVDPSLQGMYPAKSLSRFADIVSSCVQPEPEFRPPMSEVVQALVRLVQRAGVSSRKSTADDLASTTSPDLLPSD